MGGFSAKPIFPQSFKTAGVTNATPIGDFDPVYNSASNPTYGVIGFQLYQPYNLYAVKKMMTHFKCTFDASVGSALQKISRISLGSSNGFYPSATAPYQNVSFSSSGGVLEFTMDLTNLITPTGDNIVYLYFPKSLVPGDSGWSGHYNQIVLEVWKVDMLYQTVGIR